MLSCKKQLSKKYTTRNSPPYRANDCKNLIKKGNDGLSYISSPDKNGIYKWKINSDTKKPKKIINNGSIMYVAFIKPDLRIEVYTNLYSDDKLHNPDKKILDMSYIKLFLGDNLLNDPKSGKKGKFIGNSILIQTEKNKYVYIGTEIYSFKTKEDINKYYSPVGNSGVPYPYAVGKTLTYFMLDKETLPNELLELNKDAYGQFYGHAIKDNKLLVKINKAKQPFKVKFIKHK